MLSKATTDDNHPIWSVRSQRVIDYDVIETSDLLAPTNQALLMGGEHGRVKRRFVVVDEAVYEHHGARIHAYFEENKVIARILPVTATEQNKGFELFFQIASELDAFCVDRRLEPVIAIGGGVLTDVVSFVAGCYRRGIPCIRVPTTLMGLVDAAIGVKTAVNFNNYKNRMGFFEPPYACLLDRSFLRTLPMRHIRNGVGEIVKLALIRDRTLFELLETDGAAAIQDRFVTKGTEIYHRSIHGMLEELAPNLFEDNLERAVDYGHTFSPLLEMRDLDGLLHGEAVAIDCAFAAVLSQERGFISQHECERVFNTMEMLGLPVYHPHLDADMAWESLVERTTHRAGYQRVPLITGIGKVGFVNDITHAELDRAVNVWRQRSLQFDAVGQ